TRIIIDPCSPSPCGPGTDCRVNVDGNPVCHCQPGLIPKPDTITGCGPECIRDPDCGRGLVCLNQRCAQKSDPCDPSPCGPGTTCQVNRNGNPSVNVSPVLYLSQTLLPAVDPNVWLIAIVEE
ncbi:Uncharacterized protein FKW44_024192, partial [Caligus rogercresseyi]